MALNVEYWSKDAAIQYWSLHLRENSWLERKAQNKQTNNSILILLMNKVFFRQVNNWLYHLYGVSIMNFKLLMKR